MCSNVMLVCPQLRQADPRRPQVADEDGQAVRVCKKCGKDIPAVEA